MIFDTGWFATPEKHHSGWAKVYKFDGAIEIWLGHRWILVGWK